MNYLAPMSSYVEYLNLTTMRDKQSELVMDIGETKPWVGGPENVSFKAMRYVSAIGLEEIVTETEPEGPKALVLKI